jgi:L-threonylcarbamoyladenylate synthase
MQILRATKRNILAASRIVKAGGLVVYPTETVYGLGCNPFHTEAVRQITKVKGLRKKPLPVLASDIEYVEKIAYLSKKARRIAEQLWPGPLTLVVPKKPILPNAVTSSLDSVGVRIPHHDVAIQLIRLSSGLLVGTSANKTGREPPRTAYDASEQLGEEVNLILDGGTTLLGAPSTILDLTSKKPKILREGSISLEEIADALTPR